MGILTRHLLHPFLLHYLENPDKILVIEGVRQTGKTTAIQTALQGKAAIFITLSDEDFQIIQVREAATFDEFSLHLQRNFHFYPERSRPLVLDEAQRSKHLYSFIMQMEKKWANLPVILSGSVMGAFFQRPQNKKIVTPAGRVDKFICRPFSFHEFLEWTGRENLLAEIISHSFDQPFPASAHEEGMRTFFEYLACGGFPEAIARRGDTEALYNYFQILLGFFWQDADRYLTEILESPRHQYGSLMQVLLKTVAAHTGSPTKRSSLISTDSPAYRTVVPALLDAMEEWHFLFRLPTTMKTMTTKQGFSSKKYLWDVGVTNHLLHLSRPLTANSDEALLARLLENFVAQELIFYLKFKERLSCWKSHQKQERELDFLARFPDTDVALEAKTSNQISQKAISQLREYLKVHREGMSCIVYFGPFQKISIEHRPVLAIPPYLLGQFALHCLKKMPVDEFASKL